MNRKVVFATANLVLLIVLLITTTSPAKGNSPSTEDIAAVRSVLGSSVQVAAGAVHTCALLNDGGVKCWGNNTDGRLGDGTTTNRSTPSYVAGLSTGVVAIGANWHTCAVTNLGGVLCWGRNNQGQIGDGTLTTRLVPVSVTGLHGTAISITIGYRHTCALTNAGSVECWGDNYVGQLGDGTRLQRSTPVVVGGLSNTAVAISAGWDHTCAIVVGGGVKCWGRNDSYQLGDGTQTYSSSPVDVIGLSAEVVAIVTGGEMAGSFTCAVTSLGAVQCWGSYGGATHSVPTEVPSLSSGIVALSGYSQNHLCVITSGGAAKCWDGNHYVDVAGLSRGVTSISMGGAHMCAIISRPGLMCWGENWYGQLGIGSTASYSIPISVSGPTSDLVDLSISVYHSVPQAERAGYEEALAHFADGVFEMSNGVHKISRISIYQDGQNAASANILWNHSEWPRAQPSGYWQNGSGQQIFFGDVFPFPSGPYIALASQNLTDTGYALAHEWGHYFYGLYDEYAADSSANDAVSYMPHSSDIPIEESIMNNSWNGKDSSAWLNASAPKNYTAGLISRTAQSRVYGASGWSTLAREPFLDPPVVGLTTLPKRTYFPELAAVAPEGNSSPSIELPTGSAAARSHLEVIWLEPPANESKTPEGATEYRAEVEPRLGTTVLYPTPLLLRAKIAKGLPLTGVDVESAIQSAAGVPQVIQLKDDGAPPDRAANDGEYIAQFSYSQGGIHQITTTFHVVSGVAMLTEAGPLPSIGPFGESFSPTLTAVRESYTTAVTSTVNVIGFAADDHGNVTSTATLLAWNNLNVAGRIDSSGDVDAFRSVSSLAGFRVVRVHTLGNGMQPRLRVFGKTDTSPLQEKVMAVGAEMYLYVWVWMPAGEPLFALIDDVRPGATGGTYSVSVGPPLDSGAERVSFVFVPAILR